VYLAEKGFAITGTSFEGNMAKIGGGIFISADLNTGASLAQLSLSGNIASIGVPFADPQKTRSLFRLHSG
jgi:hypothetical protein